MSKNWSIRELAASQLGIDDEDRLDEIEDLSGLLEMIRGGMPESFVGEVPPSLTFIPGSLSPDFWHGLVSGRD